MRLSITPAHKADRHLSVIHSNSTAIPCICIRGHRIFLEIFVLLSKFFAILIVKFSDDSMLGSWPSFDPHNFSQFKPNDPSNPSKMTPVTYHPTHERTLPPPHQVIAPEAKNILLRHFYQHAEEKLQLRTKRASPDNPTPERASKLPRASASDDV